MEYIIMTRKETEQVGILEQVKIGNLTQVAAAKKLGLSDRQVRNKYKVYLNQGAQGLVHKGRGRPGNRRVPEEVKDSDLRTSLW